MYEETVNGTPVRKVYRALEEFCAFFGLTLDIFGENKEVEEWKRSGLLQPKPNLGEEGYTFHEFFKTKLLINTLKKLPEYPRAMKKASETYTRVCERFTTIDSVCKFVFVFNSVSGSVDAISDPLVIINDGRIIELFRPADMRRELCEFFKIPFKPEATLPLITS